MPITTNSADNELSALPPKSGVIDIITNTTNLTLSNNPPTNGESLNSKLIPGLNSSSQQEKYLLLADQISSDNIISTTVFDLLLNGSIIDTIGSSSVDTGYSSTNNLTNFLYSLKRNILYSSGSNNSGSINSITYGGLSRNKSNSVTDSTAPSTTFNVNEWAYRSNSQSSPDSVLSASAIGDPHITTIYGNTYKFNYIGPFRLFDNNHPDKNKRIIINGMSMRGSKKRWRRKQYIRKIYIQYGEKFILINTGFRGTKAHIIENNGINYKDTDLNFNKKAKIHCFFCGTDFDLNGFTNGSVKNHIKRNKRHIVLKPVRNEIII